MGFIIDGRGFHCQRSGNGGKSDIYLTTAEETPYRADVVPGLAGFVGLKGIPFESVKKIVEQVYGAK